jgi:hypothetical protein
MGRVECSGGECSRHWGRGGSEFGNGWWSTRSLRTIAKHTPTQSTHTPHMSRSTPEPPPCKGRHFAPGHHAFSLPPLAPPVFLQQLGPLVDDHLPLLHHLLRSTILLTLLPLENLRRVHLRLPQPLLVRVPHDAEPELDLLLRGIREHVKDAGPRGIHAGRADLQR